MKPHLRVISSMATRQLLAELAEAHQRSTGVEVRLESVGGVDAARRVAAGEVLDLVVLASDAIVKLTATGALRAFSSRALADSPVAIAVQAGAPRPDVSSAEALRQALLQARSIGYSTGPSGHALLQMLERWGLVETLRERLVQAPPGVPVGTLIARGEVELGFQQRSELMHLDGITVLGGMPPSLEIISSFVGAIAATSAHPEQAAALLDFMGSGTAAAVKRRHGMDAPQQESSSP
jgi:molybdate transport system substrate-binding protein